MAISLQADGSLPRGYISIDNQRVASFSTTGGLSATLAPNTVTTQSLNDVSVTSSKLAYDNGPAIFRNRIINGGMDIWQKSYRSATIGTNQFPPFTSWNGSGTSIQIREADRWFVSLASIGTTASFTLTNSTDAPAGTDLASSLRITATSVMNYTGTKYLAVWQRLEGYYVRDLVGKTFTLSFWVKATKTGTHYVSFRNYPTSPHVDSDWRSYVTPYTINQSNTWERKTITVPGGINTGGVSRGWDFTNGHGLSVLFSMANSPDVFTTSSNINTWLFENNLTGTDQVNGFDTIGNIFAITGVQLEEGSIATPFERRPYDVELSMCKRYYTYENAGYSTASQANIVNFVHKLPVQMRTQPTVTASDLPRIGIDAFGRHLGVYCQPVNGYSNVVSDANAEVDASP